jgi:hypothetical protein
MTSRIAAAMIVTPPILVAGVMALTAHKIVTDEHFAKNVMNAYKKNNEQDQSSLRKGERNFRDSKHPHDERGACFKGDYNDKGKFIKVSDLQYWQQDLERREKNLRLREDELAKTQIDLELMQLDQVQFGPRYR